MSMHISLLLEQRAFKRGDTVQSPLKKPKSDQIKTLAVGPLLGGENGDLVIALAITGNATYPINANGGVIRNLSTGDKLVNSSTITQIPNIANPVGYLTKKQVHIAIADEHTITRTMHNLGLPSAGLGRLLRNPHVLNNVRQIYKVYANIKCNRMYSIL